MKVLAQLKHPNIVSYQESFEGKTNAYTFWGNPSLKSSSSVAYTTSTP